MNKEELEYCVEETLKFNNIDEAFEDYVWDMNEADIVAIISDEEKERIISLSPSYVKHKDKYYFNGEFQELQPDEITEIINEIDKKEA